MRVPSGLHAALVTSNRCSRNAPSRAPLIASHSRAVVSPAVTTRVPSGLNPAVTTVRVWPSSTARDAPLIASHSRAVLSSEAVTTRARPGSMRR